MKAISPPPGWGNDSLSKYLQDASENAFHVFHHASPVFSVWRRINDLYRHALDNMNKAKPWFPTLFLPRAHSSWLAAVRSAASGQLPEAYMLVRGCLENALYAFYIQDDPELPGTVGRAETFLRRHDGDDWKKKVKREFHPSEMLKLLESKAARIGRAAGQIYEVAIDNGAHPNDWALLSNLDVRDAQGGFEFRTDYMNADPVVRGLCWKYTAYVGVCTLDVFGLMWRTRFQLLGLADRLDGLRQEIDGSPDLWKAVSEPEA